MARRNVVSNERGSERPPKPAGAGSARVWRRGAMALVVALLAACAIPHPGSLREGMAEGDVVALMGPPTGRYPLPESKTRLEFAQGPMGRTTWMVDLDASGRATQFAQVLDPWYFVQVADGMDRDALLRILGRPGDVQSARLQREIWYWRYPNNDCLIAVAMLSAQGHVEGGVSMMPDPRCNSSRD
jgi:hypothetical protein